MKNSQTFCTAINCMDGRTQRPVNKWMRKHFDCEYVDTITEPGPVKILSEQQPKELVQSIIDRLKISIEKHGSKGVSIVAHYDCTGNPVDKKTQIDQLQDSVAYIKMHCPGAPVLALWVNEGWKVELVK